jgi:hypothetical protein
MLFYVFGNSRSALPIAVFPEGATLGIQGVALGLFFSAAACIECSFQSTSS